MPQIILNYALCHAILKWLPECLCIIIWRSLILPCYFCCGCIVLALLLLLWFHRSLLFRSNHHQSLLCRFIFTADPRGILKLWRLSDPLPSGSLTYGRTFDASLVAEFTSCFGIRIMCLDASFEDEVSALLSLSLVFSLMSTCMFLYILLFSNVCEITTILLEHEKIGDNYFLLTKR